MGKNKSASGLINVIQYDNNGNIAFVSGSTTLMQVSSSGAITTTGTISGGAAADALLLNGTGSLAFVTTASYNVASASFSSRTTQVERTYATTGSNTFTGPQYASNTSNAISFTSTASLYSDGGLRVQGNSFVSGTAYFNNIVVYGTSSIQYITSSQVNIGANIITVNTDTPAVRFGGLSVFDSGSTQLTGSIFWDSEKNHWIYSNPSGSSYSGGMLISGPRSSALGCEQGTTSCMLLVGQGGDHLTSSLVYHSSTTTCIPNMVLASGCIGINTSNPNNLLTVASGSIGLISNSYGSTGLLRIYGTDGCEKYQQGLTTGGDFYQYTFSGQNHIFYTNGANERMRIFSGGNVSIGRCDDSYRLNIATDTPKTCTTARGLLSLTTCETFACNPFGLVITATGGASLATRRVTIGTTDFGLANGGLLELNGALFVCNNGNVGIGCASPSYILDVRDGTTGSAGGRGMRLSTCSNSAGPQFRLEYQCTGDSRNWLIGTNQEVAGDFIIRSSTIAGCDPGGVSSVTRLLISKDGNVGIGNTNARTRLQVTPSYNAEAPVLGCASGVAIFTSANSNYGLQFNSTSDGSFHIQSQRFDANTTSYNLVLQPVGSGVTIGTASGTIDAANQKLQVYGAIRQDVRGVSYGEGMIMNFPADGTNYGGLFLHSTSTALQTVGASSIKWGINYNYTPEDGVGAGNLAFVNANTTTMMNITSGGCVYIGKGWGATNHRINLQKPQGCTILVISGYSGASNDSVIIKAASGANPNGTTTVMEVTTNSATGRSISAGGTINGSGTDYAEYMTKRSDAGCIAKGQIVGIDACKLLTDKWSLAQSFVVKSTDPSYVGGDIWDKHLGKRPQQTTDVTDEEFAPILAEYEAKLEEARHKVDRIAFSGQVPVIVSGSYNVGDYILPIEGPNDTIIGVACSLSSLTLQDYGKTVGKVWGTCLDKAWIAVKIG